MSVLKGFNVRSHVENFKKIMEYPFQHRVAARDHIFKHAEGKRSFQLKDTVEDISFLILNEAGFLAPSNPKPSLHLIELNPILHLYLYIEQSLTRSLPYCRS